MKIAVLLMGLLLTGCGVEVASVAATSGVAKQQELDQGKQTIDQVNQKLEQASQQAQQRAEEGSKEK